MKIKVIVTRNGQTLYVGTYDVVKEGDVEAAVTDSLANARKAAGGGLIWDMHIAIEKA